MVQNITPIMTSNTSPSPYIISASSSYIYPYQGVNNDCWNAFTRKNNVVFSDLNTWSNNRNQFPCWIKIDLSKQTKINQFSFRRKIWSDNNVCNIPSIFRLEGSNDNINWTILKKCNETVSSWVNPEKKYTLDKNANYRYYRIYIDKSIRGYNTSDYDQVYLSNVNFLYDDELFYTPSESIKEAVYSELKKVVDKYSTAFETEE